MSKDAERRKRIETAYVGASNKCQLVQVINDDDLLLDLKRMVAEYAQEMDKLVFEELVMPLIFNIWYLDPLYRASLMEFNCQTNDWIRETEQMAVHHPHYETGHADDRFEFMMSPETNDYPRLAYRQYFCARPHCVALCTCNRPLVWLYHPIHERWMIYAYPLQP